MLDVGCGVGHLSGFFGAGARVVCVDARPENIARLHSLYPGREAHVANVELIGCRSWDDSILFSVMACCITLRIRLRLCATWRAVVESFCCWKQW